MKIIEVTYEVLEEGEKPVKKKRVVAVSHNNAKEILNPDPAEPLALDMLEQFVRSAEFLLGNWCFPKCIREVWDVER